MSGGHLSGLIQSFQLGLPECPKIKVYLNHFIFYFIVYFCVLLCTFVLEGFSGRLLGSQHNWHQTINYFYSEFWREFFYGA